MVGKLSFDEQLIALKSKVFDTFSGVAIEGAQHALAATENPLRLNFFSTAMRILFEHMMDTLAPADQVMQSPWFVLERDDRKSSRRQRIAFAIQGGLADAFVKEKLAVDIAPLRKRLLCAVGDLSKHVHARENTIVRDRAEQDAAASDAIGALKNFLEAFHDCRSAILEPIQEELDDAAVNALISETIQVVDELASHHSLEEVYVDHTWVKTIAANSIIYGAKGSISVTLQWGSNSDVRNGDALELGKSFPFQCDIEVPLDDPWDLSLADTTYGVDTNDWRYAMKPDDWDGDR